MPCHYCKAFLLDDDFVSNYLLQDLLEEHSLAQQVLAFTSFPALFGAFTELAGAAGRESDLPNLLLLDLNMPGRDGLEVLDELLQIPGIDGSKVCVFLISAHDDYPVREKIKAYPISGFLVKPLQEQAINQLIRSALRDECELKETSSGSHP